GASCTQRKVSLVSFGKISPNSFLSSILLLGVIIVMVVFVVVMVILVVVVVAIVGVVIVVVVVGGVSFILKLSFMIIDNVVEEEDGEQIRFLGGNSFSGIKKYRGSNSSDGGNIGDGVKIVSEVLGLVMKIGDLFGVTTPKGYFDYYPKRYWEILPKGDIGCYYQDILGRLPKEINGRYYQKRLISTGYIGYLYETINKYKQARTRENG
ncbi:hypothetical protein Tco_0671332, partial [Tanacetum coccineum]